MTQARYVAAMLVAGGSMAMTDAASAWTVQTFNTPISTDANTAAGDVTLAGASVPQYAYGVFTNLSDLSSSGLAPDDGGLVSFKAGVQLGESHSLGVLSVGQWSHAYKSHDPALTFKTPPDLLPANAIFTVTGGGDATLSGSDQYIYLVFVSDAAPNAEYFGTAHIDAAGALDSVTYYAVPEPQAWALLVAGAGLAGAGLRRRRRQASANA